MWRGMAFERKQNRDPFAQKTGMTFDTPRLAVRILFLTIENDSRNIV